MGKLYGQVTVTSLVLPTLVSVVSVSVAVQLTMMCVDHVYLPPPPHLPLYLVDISLLLLRTPGVPHLILATVLPSSHANSLIERLQKMFAQDLLDLFLRSLGIESPSQPLREED